MSVANNPDLIEENRGHFRTQSITISLIPLENPGRFFEFFLLPSVINYKKFMLFNFIEPVLGTVDKPFSIHIIRSDAAKYYISKQKFTFS